jgi:hypothetical protein
MLLVNNYAPATSSPPSDPYGPDPWDINFPFPIPLASENSVVKLIPFNPRIHADAFWDVAGGSDPDLYHYIRRPMATKADLLDFLLFGQRRTDHLTFLVIDRTKPEVEAEGGNLGGAMAGMISYVMADASNLVGRAAAVGRYDW